jgi:hypothetical protein
MATKKDKRTSIITVRDQHLSFASFLALLVSHWSLPLIVITAYKLGMGYSGQWTLDTIKKKTFFTVTYYYEYAIDKNSSLEA